MRSTTPCPLTQNFSENENENHADEEPGLLSSTAHTSITNNTNSETSSKTSKTDGETGTELNETSVESVVLLAEVVRDQDGDDETVDTDDTSHNYGDDVCEEEALSAIELVATGGDGLGSLFTIRSGRRTPMAAIPTPDLAVPYEAPRQVKTMAAVQPMAPKKG